MALCRTLAWTVGLGLIASACGRLAYDPTAVADAASDAGGGLRDATTDAGATDAARIDGTVAPDAAGDAGPCSSGFGSPIHVEGVNSTAVDTSPFISADGLTLYFSSTRDGDYDLYVASRASPTGPFDAPVAIAELNGAGAEAGPTLSDDELEIFFDRGYELMTARRASRALPFEPPTSTGIAGVAPDLVDDARLLVFTWTPSTDYVLVLAERTDVGVAFAATRQVDELSSTARDGYSGTSSDGLEIFFWSDRTGRFQIHTATRPSTAALFSPPTVVSSLDPGVGHSIDEPDLSPDGRTLFFASDQPGTVGGIDIWLATRDCDR
jgi:hypothetical protein